jgi:hypothetical protein
MQCMAGPAGAPPPYAAAYRIHMVHAQLQLYVAVGSMRRVRKLQRKTIAVYSSNQQQRPSRKQIDDARRICNFASF